MKIKSNGSITPANFSIQQYNNNVDIKCLKIGRYYYGNTDSETDISELYDTNPVDLSTCNVIVRVTNPDDMVMQGNELFLTTETGENEFEDDDDIVVVNWIITDNISQYAGKRTYQLEFYHEEQLVFRTQVMNFTVNASLDTEKNILEKEPNLIKDFQEELATIMGSATDYSEYIDNTIQAELDQKINYYKEYMSVYTTNVENETIIPINISAYNPDTILLVFADGIIKKQGYDYTINDNDLLFYSGFPLIGTQIYILCLKSMTTDIQDYDLFKGEAGQDGLGVPTGGEAGQVLSKKTATDNDTEWVDIDLDSIPENSIVNYDGDTVPEGYILSEAPISGDVDTEMSDTSTNAVQNKVIKAYVDNNSGGSVVDYTSQLTSSYTMVSGRTIAKKCGKLVTLQVFVYNPNGAITPDTGIVLQVPNELKPQGRVYNLASLQNNGGTNTPVIGIVYLEPTGELKYSYTSAMGRVVTNLVYFVD